MKSMQERFFQFLDFYETALSEREGRRCISSFIRARVFVTGVTDVIERLISAKDARYRQFIDYSDSSAPSPEGLVLDNQQFFRTEIIELARLRLEIDQIKKQWSSKSER